MKIKKLAALAMACVVVAASGVALSACGDPDSGFKEDTRIWYAVGNSEKGTLKDNGWKPQVAAESLTFKRDTTKTEENVFTLKMDIYAGDGFKFVYKNSADETFASDDEVWARQVGIYNFSNVSGEGADAVIKSGEDTLFTTKDGIDANNLYCAKGQDGKYTITLKTFPEKGKEEKVEFSVTKDEAIKIPYDMYVYGDMNDFGWSNKADYAMTSAKGVWTYKLNVNGGEVKDGKYTGDLLRDAEGKKVAANTKGAYAAIQLHNDGEGAAAGDPKTFALTPGEGDNFLKVTDADHGEINLLPEGKWTITFTEEGKVLSIAESAYELYFRGTGTGMTWDTCPEDVKLSESGDGTYQYGYIEVTSEQATAGGIEFKVYNKKNNEWYGPASGNFSLTEAGKYFVKFDVETETVKYEKYDYYLVGTFMDGTNQVNFAIKAGITPKFTASETDGVYTVTYNFADVSAQYTWMGAGNIAAVKGAWGTELGGIANSDWYGSDTGNLMITSTGEWTITLTLSENGGSISATKNA